MGSKITESGEVAGSDSHALQTNTIQSAFIPAWAVTSDDQCRNRTAALGRPDSCGDGLERSTGLSSGSPRLQRGSGFSNPNDEGKLRISDVADDWNVCPETGWAASSRAGGGSPWDPSNSRSNTPEIGINLGHEFSLLVATGTLDARGGRLRAIANSGKTLLSDSGSGAVSSGGRRLFRSRGRRVVPKFRVRAIAFREVPFRTIGRLAIPQGCRSPQTIDLPEVS